MSCYNPCLPCQPCGPTPLANSCNEPCVRQCQDSNVFIQPSPVVVTLPGPILSSFPQNTAVGSSTSAAVGSILSSEGVPINSGGFGLSSLGSFFSSPAKAADDGPGEDPTSPTYRTGDGASACCFQRG
ncbi:PREDICTED: feather keratin 4-like [Leptosomus discolor]|uniref:feather keratin 4-like n=1 Tax=Leptosomus discolor TaxID=188344 RepID=UPI00052239A0|nr:PREDICTED: feather keratin 4-like [Leptosomus discolor]